ncbi:MAG: hypothetical protein GAK37_01722 [Pseudomonas sp.]|nr:MAG: hypothetical protein GAK37_01722 [Pseudomonas sp.]
MPRHDARQCALQRFHVQLPAQTQADGDVVGGVGAFHQRQEPQALLGKRQRQVFITRGRQNVRQGAAPGFGQHLGHRRQFGVGEQVAQGQVHAQALAHLGHHAHGQQRVAAQLKEVVLAPHALHLQHVGPDLRQQGFDLAFGRFVVPGKAGRQVRCGQRLAVQFAVGGQRQRVEPHIGHRHHVVGQARHQMRANLAHLQRIQLRVLREVSHQPGLAGLVFAGQHHGFLQAGQLVEAGFDFPQFDTHATDFHLVVIAAQVLDIAVGTPAHQVAGAVHAAGVERVVQEALGGKLRTVQVTPCHALAAHIQLTGHTQRHRALLLVEHIHRGVGHRLADVQHLARLYTARRGHHRGFGGAIVVDDVKTLRLIELAQAVATNQQGAQGGMFQLLAERVFGHRRGQEAHVQRLRAPPIQQGIEVFGAVMGGRQMQGGPGTQCRPHFPRNGVKAKPRHAGRVAAGNQVKGIAVPVHQVGHGVVFHHHPFGQAGGAGGVDHVGQVLRGHGGAWVVDGLC